MRQIVLDSVGKQYGKNLILQDVSVTFSYGQVYGIIGENGIGKTVLLRIICGLSAATEGSVRCDGKAIGKDMEFLPSCGVIIETPGFLDSRTGIENLMYLDSLTHKPDAQKVRYAMRQCGLDPDSRKKVAAYSLGMRQRLDQRASICSPLTVLQYLGESS